MWHGFLFSMPADKSVSCISKDHLIFRQVERSSGKEGRMYVTAQ